MARHDEQGFHIPDPTPVEVPLRVRRAGATPLADMVERILSKRLRAFAEANDLETLEEANDFDVPDPDGDPSPTIFETLPFMTPEAGDDDATPGGAKPPEETTVSDGQAQE